MVDNNLKGERTQRFKAKKRLTERKQTKYQNLDKNIQGTLRKR